eukprot:4502972-Karenia_brevis.AAC.1
MELLKQGPTSSTGAADKKESESKVRMVGQKIDSQLLSDVAKLALNSAMVVRHHNAVLMVVFQMDSDAEAISLSKAASTQWDATQKHLKEQGKSQEEVKKEMGPPSVH